MNNYPVWWDSTITIFNRYEDPQTQVISWYSYTVENCFWKGVGTRLKIGNISGVIRSGEVTLESADIICRIPKHNAFLERAEWLDLTNVEKSNYFTLSPNDIIVKGAVTDTINEYATGYRSTDLLKKYKALQGCMIIEEVGINVGAGRGNEHYYVKGI